jgi:hypothetical protein
MKCKLGKGIGVLILPVITLILESSLLLTGVLGVSSTNNTNSSSNSTSVSWIYDSGLTGIAVTDVNISKDPSKDSGITVTGLIENKDPDATKLAVTLNLHMYDKTKELLGVIPSHPAEILKPLQKIYFVVKDPTRQTAINLDHVYLQVRAFDCGTASVHNMGCFGQTVNVTKKDTNDSEKKLALVKTTLPTGVFESKVLSANNLSTVGNGNSYDILGKIKNISNETKEGINLIVEIYNSTNHLVGVDQGYPIFSTLRPNEESPFKVNTNVPRLSNDHYVVTVGALESAIDQPQVNATLSNNTIDTPKNNNDIHVGTLQQCYENNMAWMFLANVLSAKGINILDPALKRYFIDTCEFYKSQLGFYPMISALADNEKVRSRISDQALASFYETHPEPEALKQIRELSESNSEPTN